MQHTDKLILHYKEILEGNYDCVDRIVLNGYFKIGCSPGGFRTWFRRLNGDDKKLNNTTLMKMSGRFSKRAKDFCKKRNIPLMYFKSDEKMHAEAEKLIPTDKNFTGLFAIFVKRAPGNVYDVKESKKGSIDIVKKKPLPLVNHYYFQIIDSEWGHITIDICGHPPFAARIFLNGHEWVERKAIEKGIKFTKESNCFTSFSSGEALSKIADTLYTKGQLEEVCNRWIYQCLWFGLNKDEQKRSDFKYSYSVYQTEYSRNLLFKRGSQLDQMYQNLITLTREILDIKRLKTIMGNKKRRFFIKGIEISIEKPTYDLTIFKIHFGYITLKLYDKGERILRAEVVIHNVKVLKCKRSIQHFPEIVRNLQNTMQGFMDNLCYSHVSLLDDGTLKRLTTPAQRGKKRLARIDFNKQRNVWMMQSILALALQPGGFSISDAAKQMKERMNKKESKNYNARNASYDLSKFKGKDLLEQVPKKRKLIVTPKGIQTIVAILVMTQKTLPSVLSAINKETLSESPVEQNRIENLIINIRNDIKALYSQYGVKLAA